MKKIPPVDVAENDAFAPNHKCAVEATPTAFTQLFRYTTSFERFLDAIGLIAAAIAGSAQPLMSLLFGNLTQKFVSFGSLEAEYHQHVNNATALQELVEAAALFRSAATSDALLLGYIGIGTLICTFIYVVIWAYTGELNAKRIRERYLQSVLRQEIAYFDAVGAGEITNRIQTATHLVQQGTSEKVAITVSCLSCFITGFVLAFVQCWRLALALSSIIPCTAILGVIVGKLMSSYIRTSLKHVAEGGTLAEEAIFSIRTAHAFGIQQALISLYDVHIQGARIVDVKSTICKGVGMGVFSFIIMSSYALAFQFGSTLINKGYANVGQVINVVLAILIGSFSLVVMAPEMQAITNARGAAAELFATIERIPNIDSSDAGGLKPERVAGDITLKNVKFNYPSRPDVHVIKGIDITFTAGETAALVGASGSGKTTVISLIERFYDPQSGTVKLDGVDIRDLNITWLRSQIGLVSQEPTLFATTVRGNVAHGLINTPHEYLSEEDKFKLIKEACIKANADDFISRLPNGYDTMVGEGGFLLSGGQKQRVAIARAIVSNPRILLLDEATSALDTRSEGIVQDALDKASAGRTTIVIAHRLSTIQRADCIYVMKEGLVLEKGTHSELLANQSSAYSGLVDAQKLREKNESGNRFSTAFRNMDWAGEVVEKKASPGRILDETDDCQYSMPYLFMRIGLLNREGLWRYAVGAAFAIVTGMGYPSFGIVYGKSIFGLSQVEPSVRQHEGNYNALWCLTVAILWGFSIGFQTYYFAHSAAILTSKIRSLCFKAILRQNIEYFDKRENSTGSIISSLGGDPQHVNGLSGTTLGILLQCFTTLVGGFIIGLVYAWKLTLIGIACIPCLVSTGYVRFRAIALKDRKNREAHECSAQLACEAAAAIRTVASLTREQDCLRLYTESLDEPLRNMKNTAVWNSLLYAFSQSASLFSIALVFWYGTRLISKGEISLTAFFISLMTTTFGAMHVGNTFVLVPDISSAYNAAAAIVQLIDSSPNIDTESPTGKTFEEDTVRGEIRFERVGFRYPTRPDVRVLQDLSFDVEPGTYVALVGPSGCGKSTIIQLLEQFYDPLSGQIFFDGHPINEFNIREYRKQIALVSQEPTLYAGTIRFNILLGATKPQSEVTQEEIEAACRDANIIDFIQSLPDGFETQVGGKGSQLSGGQKQRIAIARALLRNPKVLLLDEATSALDSNSEKVVQDALDQAAKGRTTIAIAHRLSTIQNADFIYFIKKGCVSEAGTHDDLLALRGDYYEYVQMQALNKEK